MNILRRKEQVEPTNIPLGLKSYHPERIKYGFNALLSIAGLLPRGKANAVDIELLMSRSGLHAYEGHICYDIMAELVRMKIYSYDKKSDKYFVEDR